MGRSQASESQELQAQVSDAGINSGYQESLQEKESPATMLQHLSSRGPVVNSEVSMALSEIEGRMDQFIDEGFTDDKEGATPKEDICESMNSIDKVKPNSMSSVFQTSGQYRMSEILN